MPGIEDYLSGLWQAITGNSQQASNAPAGVYSANAYMNQQPQVRHRHRFLRYCRIQMP